MRQQILFLSQCLPYPPHSGVTNRTYHVLLQLQRRFDVTLVAFSRRNHQADHTARANSTSALRAELSRVLDSVPIASEWSLAKKIQIHFESVMARKPYIFFDYASRQFGKEIETALHDNTFDLVHLDSLDVSGWLPLIPSVPITCTHHSIESELLRLRATHIGNRLSAAYLNHQAKLLEATERALCGRFALNVMTSELDATRLRALVPRANTASIPNGVDVNYFTPTESQRAVRGRVVFLGPTYMFPNRDGVEFFLSKIWPLILSDLPNVTFHLLGKNSHRDKTEFESNAGVTCHGYVDDIRPHFAAAQCSVVPLRTGGGTRLKILDAWAMGSAIVSTSIGCEGLAAVDGTNILIRDDPRQFAEAVTAVLRDGELRRQLGENGRKTAETIYAWSVVGDKLNGAYSALMRTDASVNPKRLAVPR
ncbi:MAG: glycosyltransferase family 4 protein [Gemmatimonadaceae bacterium]